MCNLTPVIQSPVNVQCNIQHKSNDREKRNIKKTKWKNAENLVNKDVKLT